MMDERAPVEKEKASLSIDCDGEEVEPIIEPEAKSGAVEDEESEDEYDTRLTSVKNFQAKQENNTCLLPRDMASKIIMNPGKSTITVATENKTIQIAPGTYKLFFLHIISVYRTHIM